MSETPDTSSETVTPIVPRPTVADARTASMASGLGTALQAAMREVFRSEGPGADEHGDEVRSEPAA